MILSHRDVEGHREKLKESDWLMLRHVNSIMFDIHEDLMHIDRSFFIYTFLLGCNRTNIQISV